MELEQLQQLTTIAQEGTFSAAARTLNISQPALSRSIQRLEKELGQPLFDRCGRNATLNAAGKLATEHAQLVLHEAQMLRDTLADHARQARALRVGTVAPAPLWRLTALLIERMPQTLLSSTTLSAREVEQQILNAQIDLGISTQPCGLPTIRCCQLMTESLSVCLPQTHALAHKKSLSHTDLDGETFLLSRDIGFWRGYCNKYYPHSQFIVQEDRVVFEQMLSSTALPYFVTDVPSLRTNIPSGRVIVPLRDTSAHATYYLLARETGREEATAAFDWVKEHA